ncbi:MAG: hypothetical protein ACRDMA_07435 [Solirubrobacterales bacterium]
MAEAADGSIAAEARAQVKRGDEWTRRVELSLSPGELDLPAGAPARELARAALERKAGRLGLPRSLRGVRLARELNVPAGPQGASELDLLRFQQTVRGTRVVWSQIDVTIAAGNVSSIGATVVPVTDKRLAGERKLGRKRALRIARRAVKGPEEALRPLRVAYAGTPTKRKARSRTPRLAWVVETMPAKELDQEDPTALCIVVDAKTGKVLARWKGIADRPDRGTNTTGDPPATVGAPGDKTARGGSGTTTMALYDGTNGAQGAPLWATFVTAGDPFDGRSWSDDFGILGSETNDLLFPAYNALNAARTVCVVRDYCGKRGFRAAGPFGYWQVVVNAPGNNSSTSPSQLIVKLSQGDTMGLDSFNDVVAHEMGHVMDLVYAGDRVITDQGQVVRSVQEALADMFALDYDRADTTMFEESATGVARNPGFPESQSECDRLQCKPFPAHMDDFDDTPTSPHFNSTILSHAYVKFVQRVGHRVAGDVLQYVPWQLSPQPTFVQVRNAFVLVAGHLYPADDPGDPDTTPEVREAAIVAFQEVGFCFGGCP